ncbi:MAG: 3-hydroxyacyl-CoA dehydrogenase NAD-binding domain-containing protein [Gammaproteobacteria bacterium]|jgi:3-hydroxyacyl-CoA dehydrogenase/enoyl-CoA hydratase/3-hydroxybutyryl-CoA epimerase
MSMQTSDQYKHWKLEYDDHNIAWLHLDMADSKVNLLAGVVLDELRSICDELANYRPQGAIILSDKQGSFIFGADIKEFLDLDDIEQSQPFLDRGHEVMNKLAALPFPTVSMVNGMCLGGGTELSLACDYIVASDDASTRLGLPEIKLGIHPGYGGTARSIQRCGPLPAMDIMLTGRAIPSRTAKKIGLIDECVPERQLRSAAVSFVLEAPKRKRPPFVQRLLNNRLLRPLVASQMRKQVARKARREHYPAPYSLIDLWQRYADNPKRMLREEAISVAKLATSQTAHNLVRVFFLQEQLKSQGKQVAYAPSHVHVIGGGIMGGDIASWCAIQGYRVTVQDQEPSRLAQTIKRAQSSFRKKYKRDRRSIVAASDRLMADHKGYGISKADIIIEAIFEDVDVKRKLYRDIEPRMKADAILATNTSSIRLEDLSSSLKQPGRLVGLHFFNPVAKMPLVEIIRGSETDEEVVQKALAFGRNISKLPLPVKSSPGFLVNRILMPYLLEAVTMVDEGVPPEVIDKAATDFGMPMGPIELADTVGLDICKSVAEILSASLGMPLPDNLNAMSDANKLGKKSGEGFYKYKKGKAVKNKSARYPDVQKVQDRLVMRLLNEATACLREEIVQSDDLIDAGVIFGTGFAPFRGGPIHYIRETGKQKLADRMNELRHEYGERFQSDTAWAGL